MRWHLWIFTYDYAPKQVHRHIHFVCKTRGEAEGMARYYLPALNVYIYEE